MSKTPRAIKWAGLSVLSGLLAGIATAIFLILLDLATKTRLAHREIIWFLPLAGWAIGEAYFRFGARAESGNNLVLDEIHDPQRVLPLRMTPFVLLGTLITHLFGGSAGREGTAVQMGASLSDQLSKYFRVGQDERKILLVAGAGAGFGAAIGAPIAGIVFGMEMIRVGRLKLFAPVECTIASLVAYYTAVGLGAPHSVYPSIVIPPYSLSLLLVVVVAGILFGLAARLFVVVTHFVELALKKFVGYPPLRPFIAGVLLCGLYWAEGSYRYAGLGIETIQRGLAEPSALSWPWWKIGFTALTIGSGFKGGEFIPLVFVGTTLGSALSVWLPASVGLLGALGFAAVFGAGANTPIACTIMAMEIFGLRIGGFALVACFSAYLVSGMHGIYKKQRRDESKMSGLKSLTRFFYR
jgi:H+/Cl- antiporter ClcA